MSGLTQSNSYWQLLKQTTADWLDDKAPRLGAALAYYAVFSIAPLIVIMVAIAGLAFGADAVSGALEAQLQDLLGDAGAEAIQDMVSAAQKPSRGWLASTIGVIALLFGASGVFGQLQDSLNTIWEVEPKPGRGIAGFLKDRFASFAMVLGTGFLLLVSLVLSAVLAALGKWMESWLPGPEWLLFGLGMISSLLVIMVLFALIFKYVPDVQIAWRDVWVGALVTALLFTAGKYLLGLYLGRAEAASAYGTVGSLIVVLLWVYYSAQILFFGAEFTQAYARMFGSHVRPSDNALPIAEDATVPSASSALGREENAPIR